MAMTATRREGSQWLHGGASGPDAERKKRGEGRNGADEQAAGRGR